MDEEEEEEILPEAKAHIEDCTCNHEPEEHGWGCCEVGDCECEGGWCE